VSESDFADVMAALRDGQAFQIGGGRIFPTYAMRHPTLDECRRALGLG
jgi:hypothetical protein